MRYLLVILLVGIPLEISGQVITDEYDLDITGSASSRYTFPASAVQCQAGEPGGAGNINPRYIVWDGPNGTICYNDTGQNTGPLFALPIGNYSAILYAVSTANGRIRSNPSNSASFFRSAPPAALTGLRVRAAQ